MNWRSSLAVYPNRDITLTHVDAVLEEFKGLIPKADTFSNLSF